MDTAQNAQLGIGRALRGLGFVWLALFIVLVLTWFGPFGSFLFIVGTGFVGYAAIQLAIAKSRVLAEGEVKLWNGLTKLVSWNPNEGVLFLRNKQIEFVDDNAHDGGGIRVVYSLLGEELALRVPLEIQTLPFEDSQVLTREYLPLTIKGTMYWKISDLSRFYLLVSSEIHSLSDSGRHSIEKSASRPQYEVAKHWLQSMAEEKTRAVISRTGTGLLIADQLASDLPRVLPESQSFLTPGPHASAAYRSATESLAETIKAEFDSSIREYGLEIHRVALQEVRLPNEIYAAAVDACKAAYLPLKAQAEALERKLKLQAEVDVLGKDVVGMKEITANIPALAFQEFLSPLFLEFNRKRVIGASTSTTS